jgi:hypothetical protein
MVRLLSPTDRRGAPTPSLPAPMRVVRPGTCGGSRSGQPRGYALVMFLVLLALLGSFTMVAALQAGNDLANSSKSLDQTQARTVAQGALDEFYARVTRSPDMLAPALAVPPGPVDHPGYAPGWASLTGGVTAAGCDWHQSCYQLAVSGEQVSAPYGTTPAAAVVQVTTRTRCASADAASCTYTRFQQRLRKRQLFDFMFFTEFSQVAPDQYDGSFAPLTASQAQASCGDKYASARGPDCVEIAYQGQGVDRDVIDGPLYTRDEHITVCGNPEFRSPVYVARAGNGTGVVNATARNDTCLGAPVWSAGLPQSANDLQLPDNRTGQAGFLALAPAAYHFTGTAAKPLVLSLSYDAGTGGQTLTVSGGGQLGTQQLPLPDTGVVVVCGPGSSLTTCTPGADVNVSGVLRGKLSVYSSGDITVPADLTYQARAEQNVPCGRVTGQDILGLTADGSVHITQTLNGSRRRVDAVLLALKGSVVVPGWATAQATPAWSGPQLCLFGAVASKYQGVFGGYDSATGALISGYHKDFSFDSRLQTDQLQPPYLLSPVASLWERLDASEVASCSGADLTSGSGSGSGRCHGIVAPGQH